MEYLKIAQDLPMYGVNYFQIKVGSDSFTICVSTIKMIYGGPPFMLNMQSRFWNHQVWCYFSYNSSGNIPLDQRPPSYVTQKSGDRDGHTRMGPLYIVVFWGTTIKWSKTFGVSEEMVPISGMYLLLYSKACALSSSEIWVEIRKGLWWGWSVKRGHCWGALMQR